MSNNQQPDLFGYHTPGPWALDNDVVRGPDGQAICHMAIEPRGFMIQQDAINGALIAAAPDMLSALIAIRQWRDTTTADCEGGPWPEMIAAISKASGGGILAASDYESASELVCHWLKAHDSGYFLADCDDLESIYHQPIRPENMIWMLNAIGASAADLRLLAVRFVKETKLADGLHAVDLLRRASIDSNGRFSCLLEALDLASLYATGQASDQHRASVRDACQSVLSSSKEDSPRHFVGMACASCIDIHADYAATFSAFYCESAAALSQLRCATRTALPYDAWTSAAQEARLEQLDIIRDAFPWPKVARLIEAKAATLQGRPMATETLQ